MERIEGRVQFQNVTFGYDAHKPVLHHIDLDVAPGEMIGFVGHSGAGKSTTINLICRFYDVNEGQVLPGHVPIQRHHRREYQLRQARRHGRGDHGRGEGGERPRLHLPEAGWL
jgi:ABC-type multidrug transport system fused ATPase/permease subunit